MFVWTWFLVGNDVPIRTDKLPRRMFRLTPMGHGRYLLLKSAHSFCWRQRIENALPGHAAAAEQMSFDAQRRPNVTRFAGLRDQRSQSACGQWFDQNASHSAASGAKQSGPPVRELERWLASSSRK
jgi:hypothetical protein